jgi:hypothetical protein
MEIHKTILLIDFIAVVGTLVALVIIVGYASPLVISPIDNLNTTNSSVLFEFQNADLILIDDNPQFSSPQEIYVQDNLVINLKPGTYFWVAQGLVPSEIRSLTIQSEINLKIKKSQDGPLQIVNSGNANLNVDIYENGKLASSVVIDVDESKEVSGNKFIGKQNE